MDTKPIPELSAKDLARFWAKVDVRGADECWPWLAGGHRGYGKVWLSGANYAAPRVVMAIDGRDPMGLCACHQCRPPCCNPAHLFAGTTQDNTADMVSKGRHACGERSKPKNPAKGERNGAYTKPDRRPVGERHGSKTKPGRLPRGEFHWSARNPSATLKGEKNPSVKLTESDVRAIRSDKRFGKVIAADYGISVSNVSQIKQRQTWVHVQ